MMTDTRRDPLLNNRDSLLNEIRDELIDYESIMGLVFQGHSEDKNGAGSSSQSERYRTDTETKRKRKVTGDRKLAAFALRDAFEILNKRIKDIDANDSLLPEEKSQREAKAYKDFEDALDDAVIMNVRSHGTWNRKASDLYRIIQSTKKRASKFTTNLETRKALRTSAAELSLERSRLTNSIKALEKQLGSVRESSQETEERLLASESLVESLGATTKSQGETINKLNESRELKIREVQKLEEANEAQAKTIGAQEKIISNLERELEQQTKPPAQQKSSESNSLLVRQRRSGSTPIQRRSPSTSPSASPNSSPIQSQRRPHKRRVDVMERDEQDRLRAEAKEQKLANEKLIKGIETLQAEHEKLIETYSKASENLTTENEDLRKLNKELQEQISLWEAIVEFLRVGLGINFMSLFSSAQESMKKRKPNEHFNANRKQIIKEITEAMVQREREINDIAASQDRQMQPGTKTSLLDLVGGVGGFFTKSNARSAAADEKMETPALPPTASNGTSSTSFFIKLFQGKTATPRAGTPGDAAYPLALTNHPDDDKQDVAESSVQKPTGS